MTTQTETTKQPQVPSLYLLENGANGEKGGKPAGATPPPWTISREGRPKVPPAAGTPYTAAP